MDTIHNRFIQYLDGNLEESLISEMESALCDLYFENPAYLSPDELEFTEDLLIDAWLNPGTEEDLRNEINQKISNDKRFRQKAERYGRLDEAFRQRLGPNRILAIESESTEEKEEEQLRSVLSEVFNKIEAEQESESLQTQKQFNAKEIPERITHWLESLIVPQHRLRLALAGAALILLAGSIWLMQDQINRPWIQPNTRLAQTEDSVKHSTQSGPGTHAGSATAGSGNTEIDRQARHADAQSLSAQQIHQSKVLLASLDLPGQYFEYRIARGAPDPNRDSLLAAAKLFNNRQYKAGITIFKDLIGKKAFTDPDTLARIHLYLGISYFNLKGMKLALNALNNVSPESEYYHDALFYRLFAHLALGEKQKSEVLLGQIRNLNDAENLQVVARKVQKILSE